MIGGDLPGWLPALFRRNGTTALTDRRGECIYAGCPHFSKCFIERSARAAAQADIVIAKHALTMVQAARPRPSSQEGGGAPATRLIRSEEHTSELHSLIRISYAVFCLKNKITKKQ